VIDRCQSNKLRKRLLKEHDISLNELLKISLIIEPADYQLNHYTKATDATQPTDDDKNDFVQRISNKRHHQRGGISAEHKTYHCFRCEEKDHLANKCTITKRKQCRKCGKPGHFANVCQSSTKAEPRENIRYIIGNDSS